MCGGGGSSSEQSFHCSKSDAHAEDRMDLVKMEALIVHVSMGGIVQISTEK